MDQETITMKVGKETKGAVRYEPVEESDIGRICFYTVFCQSSFRDEMVQKEVAGSTELPGKWR